ncbi:Phosphatidylinositol N-acetylglucosaminyltransferase subunit C [Halotydeus destructor]|nr:Phosphatidylinositol N-acetylglucosaminyltransferase subunit C [Halotydeus destructor]
MKTRSQSAKEWRKVLYQHQDFADNYVPPCFLKDLKKNVNLRHHSLAECIIGAGRLSQEICSILGFLVVYIALESSGQTKKMTYLFVSSTSFVSYMMLIAFSGEGVGHQLKSAVIFLVSGFAFSPMLKTLTETISTDTIYAMVTVMLFVHLITYDYGVQSALVSTPMSLNAGIFAAVCLASRLQNYFDAFVLLVWSTNAFVLFTAIRRRCLENLNQSMLTVSLILLSVISLYYITSLVCCSLYFVFMIFINITFPSIFFRWQTYKENIYGPWDEAVIQTTKTTI